MQFFLDKKPDENGSYHVVAQLEITIDIEDLDLIYDNKIPKDRMDYPTMYMIKGIREYVNFVYRIEMPLSVALKIAREYLKSKGHWNGCSKLSAMR